MTRLTYEHLAGLAGAHLDADTALRWLGLLRPAVRLVAAGPDDAVVARLGGTPHLPVGTPWPEWPGHGRLSFVAEFDLAALAATGTASSVGARVELTAVPATTWPDPENPELERWGLDDLPDPFVEALGDLLEQELGADGYGHQVGGWAQTVQGAVEYDPAETRLGEATYDEVHTAEALRWRPLLQVDSDEAAGTSWGDDGVRYWLARTDGTTPPGPDGVGLTWQCA